MHACRNVSEDQFPVKLSTMFLWLVKSSIGYVEFSLKKLWKFGESMYMHVSSTVYFLVF
jgi:hypothetical protein